MRRADTVTHDVLVRLRAENLGATAGIEGFRKLIVTLNPEVVFLGDGGGRSGLRAQLLEDPAFRDVEAIRRENVHELPTRLTSTRDHRDLERRRTGGGSRNRWRPRHDLLARAPLGPRFSAR